MKYLLKLLFCITALAPWQAFGCEGCKMAASKGISEPQTVMAGMAFSWSVLFMLGIFFLLLAIFGWIVYRASSEADAAHRTSFS
jgi:hypothetical protein